jgi:hypothetical protein
MASKFTIKQGVSFSFSCQYKDDSGLPKSLVGVTLTSQARNTLGFAVTFDLVVTNAVLGQFTVSAPLGTLLWPIGLLYWDVRIFIGGLYSATITTPFTVERGVTLI